MTKLLSTLILVCSCLHAGPALAQALDLRGEVEMRPEFSPHVLRGGVLFVYVRQHDPNIQDPTRTKPLAVWRIADPRFPQAFHITDDNLIDKGVRPEGKLTLMAKYSPVGHAIQRSGAIFGWGMGGKAFEVTRQQGIQIDLNQLFD